MYEYSNISLKLVSVSYLIAATINIIQRNVAPRKLSVWVSVLSSVSKAKVLYLTIYNALYSCKGVGAGLR